MGGRWVLPLGVPKVDVPFLCVCFFLTAIRQSISKALVAYYQKCE